LRRTPDSTYPLRRYRVIAALFGYLWLAQSSALGASTEPWQARAGVWGAATLALCAGVLFGRKRLSTPRLFDRTNMPHGLAEAFSRVREEAIRVERNDRPNLRVRCVGDGKPLEPTIEDEIFGIGCEALLNALRHAHAQNIEVALTFRSDSVRMVVRDDGCGIAPDVVTGSPETYRGLAEMRDRAERLGGRLWLRSAPGRGAELELRVPVVPAMNNRNNVPAGESACCVVH
jgi:hypothetical protein